MKLLRILSIACLFPLVLAVSLLTLVAPLNAAKAPASTWNESAWGTPRGFRRGPGAATIPPPGFRGESRARVSGPATRAANSSIDDPIFFIPPAYPSGAAGARSVVVEDFNGDGKPDLAVTNHCFDTNCTSGAVGILLGNGDGTYQPAVTYNSGGYFTQTVAAGDFNADGKLDLALANQCNDANCTNGSVTVLLGNGDGTFRAAVSYPSGGDAMFVAAGDLNGDGKLDLVVANNETNNVGVLLGNGNGTFQPVVEYASGGTQASSLALADLNGDGHLDLAVTNFLSGNVSILLGNGNGTFQSAVSYLSGGSLVNAVVVADFNHDNKPDLAVANLCNDPNACTAGVVGVLLGKGDGTFQPAVTYAPGGQDSYSVAAADFNGDGKLDLAVSDETTGLTVLVGAGDGTFQLGPTYDSGGMDSFFAVVADINGDGKADIVMSNDCASDCSTGSVVALIGNGNGSFHAPAKFLTNGSTFLASTAGDFNHDSRSDLVLTGGCGNADCSVGSVDVLLNAGNGNFEPAASYGSGGSSPISVAVGDFNGDGQPDIAVSNSCASPEDCSSGTMGVLLGKSDGTFQTAVVSGVPPGTLAVGDFNGDGRLDLAITSSPTGSASGSNGSVNILLGNGNGTFASAVAFSSGAPYAHAVAVADFNGDGNLDLAIANGNCMNNNNEEGELQCGTGSVGLLLGNGDGSFKPAVLYSTIDTFAFTITTGDFNGDGKLDLAVGNANCAIPTLCEPGTIAVLLGGGDGTFKTAVTYPSGDSWPAFNHASSNSVAATDLNGDGKLDLVVSNKNVLLGNGDGSFQPAQSYNPSAIPAVTDLVADFNGDGIPDLVAADPAYLTVLLNDSSAFRQAASTALTSSRNPAEVGRRVTFTATVTSSTQTPTGTVTFSDSGHALGTTPIANGNAQFSTSAFDAGIHVITASYSGDQTFLPSTSPELKQAIKADTRTGLTSSHNPSRHHQPVTFTAAVSANSGDTPTGTITFRDFSAVIGTAQLSGGEATFTTSRLHRGLHLIRATYGGSPTDRHSSALLTQRVK